MKEKIDVFDYAGEIMKAMKTGILLTTKAGDQVNTMTIGWGVLGIEWAAPIFTVFVRESRFTRDCLDKNPEFTVNIPIGDFDRKILGIAGAKSGRDLDKIEALGLHLEQPEVLSVPGIAEFPLTLECRVVYKQLQDRDAIPQEIQVNSILRMWTVPFLCATGISILRIMERLWLPISLSRMSNRKFQLPGSQKTGMLSQNA